MSLFKVLLAATGDRPANKQLAKRSVDMTIERHTPCRQHTTQHVVAWMALAFLMLVWSPIYAQTCGSSAFVQSVNIGSVTVPSTYFAGQVLARVDSQPTLSGNNSLCTTNVQWGSPMVAPIAAFPDVYRPLLGGQVMANGIGVRVTVHTATGDFYLSNTSRSASFRAQTSYFTIEVVVLGKPVESGPILSGFSGIIIRSSASNVEMLRVGNDGGTIVKPPTCSVATPSISVPMGKVPASAFKGGVGSSSPPTAPFNISLNCTGGDGSTALSIYATLTDATNAANRTDVLSLTANSQAKGVGVQIMKDGTPLKYGPDSSAPGNTNQWFAGATATNGQFNIPLTARYVQTLPAITQGSANAVATFTMNYR